MKKTAVDYCKEAERDLHVVWCDLSSAGARHVNVLKRLQKEGFSVSNRDIERAKALSKEINEIDYPGNL